MTEVQIQHILDTLHNSKDHTYQNFEREFGNPWSGYTKDGCKIIYYPETNTYTWEQLCEHNLAGWYLFDPFEISKADLIERLSSRSLRTLFLSKYLYKNGFFSFILLEKYN
jgi:hypothetical protein